MLCISTSNNLNIKMRGWILPSDVSSTGHKSIIVWPHSNYYLIYHHSYSSPVHQLSTQKIYSIMLGSSDQQHSYVSSICRARKRKDLMEMRGMRKQVRTVSAEITILFQIIPLQFMFWYLHTCIRKQYNFLYAQQGFPPQ